MAEENLNIEFDGYWTEKTMGNIPSHPGIYCVYECKYDAEENGIAIHKLISIDGSIDVNESVSHYKNLYRWKRHVGNGNQLCFSFASVGSGQRGRVKAALVFQHKPPLNGEFKDSFPFDKTTLSVRGKKALLDHHFTLNGLSMR
jgi:hypothetical protein